MNTSILINYAKQFIINKDGADIYHNKYAFTARIRNKARKSPTIELALNKNLDLCFRSQASFWFNVEIDPHRDALNLYTSIKPWYVALGRSISPSYGFIEQP
jgi:hypothetical protein